jgi:hypothetical protein
MRPPQPPPPPGCGAASIPSVERRRRANNLDPILRRDPGELGRVGLGWRRWRVTRDDRWRDLGEESLRPCRRDAGQVLRAV